MDQSRVVQQVLSPARAATRAKLLDAAAKLATTGGYDAVGVREVAAAAGVSPATAYQHVSSKDQLLIDVLFSLGQRTYDSLDHHDPRRDPADRLSAIFGSIMRQVAAKPLLYQALYRAYLTTSTAGGTAIGPDQAAWIGKAIGGDTSLNDGEVVAAADIVSCLFQGAMVRVVSGAKPADVHAVLDDAVHRLLN